MVPGGSISFDGPLENMTTNLSAYKTSKTSLENIVPVEYLTGSTEVKAIINLQGQLMRKIDPTFAFELPNASSEVRSIFYTSIDTQNRENLTKQFAYFMVTNSYIRILWRASSYYLSLCHDRNCLLFHNGTIVKPQF